jgi:hypothetical protein
MKNNKHIKTFEQHQENLNISDVSDDKIELIGPYIDDILDAINYINNNYKDVKAKTTDFQEDSNNPYVHKRNHKYSIFVKLEPKGDEQNHIRFMNDLLDKNGFKCRLYMI